MNIAKRASSYICIRCLYRQSPLSARSRKNDKLSRGFAQSTNLPQESPNDDEDSDSISKANGQGQAEGRMSGRLAQMTNEMIEQDGRSAKKVIKEGGFSEELKKKLEARLQESSFRSENAAAFAQASLPSSAGKGTQGIAAAEPWAGTERLEDAALRMLNDAHKPLRGTGPPKIPSPRGPPASVDMRMKKAVQRSHGERLANARDRTSVYALSQDASLSEKEREKMRKILKERFTAGARPMPGSVQGLAALANERIEDAIARGQFKNIARGKGLNVERDHNANSPFLDTTEYFMNKIIQKQEIVPPWIEKQQELIKAANVFRARLRADWKRHSARVIASKGGSLETQVTRAEAYAIAEAGNNPKATKTESITKIDREGRLSQVTVTETPTPSSETTDSKIRVSEDLANDWPISQPAQAISEVTDHASSSSAENTLPTAPSLPRLAPFRDPAWESLERAYHTLAITEINNITRSYNLQAPDLAKKPYFSLERELRSCFADIAPQLPNEIRERARRPEKIKVEIVGHRPGGVLERFSSEKVKVYDSRKPQYGFKQFWKDLWGSNGVKA
ncbi:hypothetical protein HO173_003916 [Letharia columbiana]|uniref:DnaJ homologue subfamily C member 28 conserved domain-containing protein n=1 Tax=Letharia columbiana TaxID=112416 RepID=A0A8H6L6Q4_9LECA|nr:uncharacterized protein HO173_003916 [Letharia columbiana]KAF6237715.1 hypothetical protein HO173_003916 [Letharia columbiana]